jgi:hypothetical protein
MAEEIVVFTLGMMKRAGMRGVINAKGYDYQAAVVDALEKTGLERTGSFSLLAREHWMRAKQPRTLKLDKSVNLAQIPSPAVNLPRTASSGGDS